MHCRYSIEPAVDSILSVPSGRAARSSSWMATVVGHGFDRW